MCILEHHLWWHPTAVGQALMWPFCMTCNAKNYSFSNSFCLALIHIFIFHCLQIPLIISSWKDGYWEYWGCSRLQFLRCTITLLRSKGLTRSPLCTPGRMEFHKAQFLDHSLNFIHAFSRYYHEETFRKCSPLCWWHKVLSISEARRIQMAY